MVDVIGSGQSVGRRDQIGLVSWLMLLGRLVYGIGVVGDSMGLDWTGQSMGLDRTGQSMGLNRLVDAIRSVG